MHVEGRGWYVLICSYSAEFNIFIDTFLISPDGKTVDVDAQLVIGADGAHSTIRSEMMKRPR